MSCEKPGCDNDAAGDFEVSGPPAGTFDVRLCEDHAPTTTPQAASD